MDATMGSIAPTGLKGKLAALEERLFDTVYRVGEGLRLKPWILYVSFLRRTSSQCKMKSLRRSDRRGREIKRIFQGTAVRKLKAFVETRLALRQDQRLLKHE